MRYRAILFDFDYTLGDSTGPITLGYQQGLTAMGWPSPTVEQVRPTIGHTLQNGYTMLTGDDDPERRDEFYRHFQESVGRVAVQRGNMTMITQTKLLPGAAELLTALKDAGVPAAIVSTKFRTTIQAIFDHNELSHLLALVVGGEDVTRAKPDPQGLNSALERLGVTAGKVLFCGDTVIDARTAQAAGTDFCAVLNGSTPEADFAPYPRVHIAKNLSELKDWLFG